MYENQIINFSTNLNVYALPLPATLDSYFQFVIDIKSTDQFDVVSSDGATTFIGNITTTRQVATSSATDKPTLVLIDRTSFISGMMGRGGVCFRFKKRGTGSTTTYSQMFKIVAPAKFPHTHVEYSCNEDAFGLPFGNTYTSGSDTLHWSIKAPLPMRIHSPQFKQSDEVYETLDGKNIVLYSKAAKEYELVTEYLPMEWHERIMLALMCDSFVADGTSLYKSGEYSIDWDNYTLDDSGNKLAMATCKLKENAISRNSN